MKRQQKAKIELSTTLETEINIPFITSTDAGPQHLLLKLSRAQLESLAEEFVTASIDITKRALDASGFKMSDINEVILVGGQTRMPKIVEQVKALFGKEPNLVYQSGRSGSAWRSCSSWCVAGRCQRRIAFGCDSIVTRY